MNGAGSILVVEPPRLNTEPSKGPGHPLAFESLRRLVDRWPLEGRSSFIPGRPFSVARAPASLDVMGGIAESFGGVTLRYPLGLEVCAAIQERDDNELHLWALSGQAGEPILRCTLPMSTARTNGNPSTLGCDPHVQVRESHQAWAIPFNDLSRLGLFQNTTGNGTGWNIVLHSETGWESTELLVPAAQTALVLALSQAKQKPMDPAELALQWCRVRSLDPALHFGVSAALGSMLAEQGRILQLRCRPHEVIGFLDWPVGLTCCAVELPEDPARSVKRYWNARTAARMGARMIDGIVADSKVRFPDWRGFLGQICVSEYVEWVRDRLPVRMKGRAFLDRFVETGDPLCEVDPHAVYKIRSRTEHHIYDNARVNRFVECLSRATRDGLRQSIDEAGELMFGSHWSYGQRCGLSNLPADAMVTSLRRCGPDQGILGARTAASGSGGLIAVMLKATADARAAVQRCIDELPPAVGKSARIHEGSSPGAYQTGVISRVLFQ